MKKLRMRSSRTEREEWLKPSQEITITLQATADWLWLLVCCNEDDSSSSGKKNKEGAAQGTKIMQEK